ncbi:MAG: glycosyltransferase family 39 protein [Anaerolineales bacterium]
MKPNKALLFGLLSTFWLALALAGYAWSHKPFSAAEFAALALTVWRAVVAAAILSLAGGLGFALLRGQTQQPLSQAMLQAALGLGLMSILTLAIGAVIGFSLALFGALLLAGLFLLRRQALAWWRAWKMLALGWKESGLFEKGVALAAILILVSTWIVAAAPPVQFDALTYHLAIPRAYLQAGRLIYLPENMFWGMPEQTEMLYTLAMLLGGEPAAALLGWTLGLLALTAVFAYSLERLGRRAAWAAVASLLAGETFALSLSWGYVDWAVMFFGMSTLIALTRWLTNQNRLDLLLAGVLAGMTLATKYTAGILLICGLIVILTETRTLGGRKSLQAVLLFGVSAALSSLPWFMKNYLATGNPFYPLLFPAADMNAIRLAFYQKSLAPRPWSEIFLLPGLATILGIEGKSGYSASIGPLLLGLSPLAALNWQTRPPAGRETLRLSALVTLSGFLIWIIASRFASLLIQTRLYFAFFPAWAVLAGAGFDAIGQVKTHAIRFGRIASFVVALALGFSTYTTCQDAYHRHAWEALLGLQSRPQYLADNLGGYAEAMQALQDLPPGSRVLMAWETRSLYCLPICDPDEVIDRWYTDMRLYQTPERILAAWQEQGYTHLLVFQSGADFVRRHHEGELTENDWETLEALLASLPAARRWSDYTLYVLPSP